MSVVCWLLVCIAILIFHASNPGLFASVPIFVICLQIATVTPPILTNLLVISFPDTIVRNLNATCDFEEDLWFHNKVISKIQQRKSSRISKNLQDITGLVVFTGVFIMSAATVVATPLVIMQNWDPFYMIFKAFGNESYLSGFPNMVIRFIIIVHVVWTSLSAARYGVVMFFYMGMALHQFFNLIVKVNPAFDWGCIRIYRQATILANDFRPFAILFFSGILSSFFAMLVAGTIACLLGLVLGETFMQITGVAIASVAVSVLMTTFFCCCRINEDSSKLLRFWRVAARRRKDAGYLIRTVRSMRAISLPAGNVGIFDRDITMNYFARVVDYVTSYLVLSRKMFVS